MGALAIAAGTRSSDQALTTSFPAVTGAGQVTVALSVTALGSPADHTGKITMNYSSCGDCFDMGTFNVNDTLPKALGGTTDNMQNLANGTTCQLFVRLGGIGSATFGAGTLTYAGIASPRVQAIMVFARYIARLPRRRWPLVAPRLLTFLVTGRITLPLVVA